MMKTMRLLAVGALAAVLAAEANALDGRVYATGLAQPLFLTAPRGDARVFVVEKGGVIRVVSPTGSSVYADLSGWVRTGGEQGLLSIAFDPRFGTNGRLYVSYSDKDTGDSIVARLTATSAADPTIDPGTRQIVLRVPQPTFQNHKGGWIGFRPGNRNQLYVALGDGGSGNDPLDSGQTTDTLLGKILRINVNTSDESYRIPSTNPFRDDPAFSPEIWAYGVRNPWRNSFDRTTGAFFIADVGQDAREEINFEAPEDPGGHNYGWRLREGTIATPGVGGPLPGATDPVFEYPHSGGTSLGRSITGGYVHRGPSIPGADGRYFFGDFGSDRLFSAAVSGTGTFSDVQEHTAAVLGGTGLDGIASFGEDGRGRLYVIGINGTIVVLCATGGPVNTGSNPCK